MVSSTSNLVRIALPAAVGVALAVGAAGCRGERSDDPPRQFFPGLDDQLKVKAQTESEFYNEYRDPETGELYGRSMRRPVEGTVAFGYKPYTREIRDIDFSERGRLLAEDDAFYRGKNPDGSWVEYMPVEVTTEFIELGREQYNIYCIVCHGGTGRGDGMVGRQWSYPLPSYHQEQYQRGGEKGADGYLFDRIRNGVPNPSPGSYPYMMRPYGTKVSVEETWAIVAYIRTLQKVYRGTVDELPPRERATLPGESVSMSEQTDSEEASL